MREPVFSQNKFFQFLSVFQELLYKLKSRSFAKTFILHLLLPKSWTTFPSIFIAFGTKFTWKMFLPMTFEKVAIETPN